MALQLGESILGDRGQARHDLEDEGLLHAAVVAPSAGEGEAGVALERRILVTGAHFLLCWVAIVEVWSRSE